MARTNVFAMRDSGLNAFLFADVGVELNGSALTILSVLARLGQDPWAQAARWAALPKAAVLEALTESIRRMPLSAEALSEAAATAARLVLLLPSAGRPVEGRTAPATSLSNLPKWVRMTIFYSVLACGLAASYFILIPRPPAAAIIPFGQTATPAPPG